MITQEDVKRIFDYNDETGFLVRKTNGKIQCSQKGKYYFVSLFGAWHPAHRIIWVWLYGSFPLNIDHKDGNGLNNKPDNLREASMSQNIANADYGFKRGIEKHGRKFRARIWVNGTRIELGSYVTSEEAKAAFDSGAKKHFGEFAFCEK